MSWQQVRDRRQIIDEVLDRTRRMSDDQLRSSPVPFGDVPGAVAAFGNPHTMLLAMQHRWAVHLANRLDQAVLEAEGDASTAVVDAWRRLAERLPQLRRVLDAALPWYERHPEVRAAVDAESRMLAEFAGLAAPGDRSSAAVAAGAGLRSTANHPTANRPAARSERPCRTSRLLIGLGMARRA